MLKHYRPDFAYIQDTSSLLDVFKYVMDLEVPADATEEKRDRLSAVKATAVDFIINLPEDAAKVDNAYVLPVELDMPAFVVLGSDPHAAEVVRYWAQLHATDPATKLGAITEVCQLAMDHAVQLHDFEPKRMSTIPLSILDTAFLRRVEREGLVDHLHYEVPVKTFPSQMHQKPVSSPVTPTRKLYHRNEIIAIHKQIVEQLNVATSRLVLIGGWEPLQGDMPLEAEELVYWADIVVHDRMVAAKLPASFEVSAMLKDKPITAKVRFNYTSWNQEDTVHLASCGICVPAIRF